MPASSRGLSRAQLKFESLEDRLVPTTYVNGPIGFDPDHVLVTFANPGSPSTQTAQLKQSELVSSVKSISAGVYQVKLSSQTAVTTAVRALTQISGVRAVQPDYVIAAAKTPNDPSYSSQWSHGKTGAAGAWNVSTGTRQTIVAVIDTGVDYSHSDLNANMWRNSREVPGNGIDDDGNGFADDVHGADFMNNDGDPMDDAGHGTHVAGIVGAVGNNGVGVSGVAWTTRVMALKFMSASGGLTSNAIRAIDYAVANGAKVINNSWGGSAADSALSAALNRARSAGVIVVAAAGNNASNVATSPYYPGAFSTQFDNLVSVAATDQNDALASFSNYGTSVSIAAPGASILSTLPRNSYGYMKGTSMAAPYVSGTIAQFWDVNPSWSYQNVIARLRESATVLPSLSGKVATGRIDVNKMFNFYVSPPVTPPVTPPPVSPPPSADITGARILKHTFSGPKASTYDRIRVQFNEAVSPTTFTASDVTVTSPLGSVSISAVLPVSGTNNTEFQMMFSRSQTTPGAYTISIGTDIRDLAGNGLNQNNNAVNGESSDGYTGSSMLSIAGVPPVVPPPPTPPVVPPPPPPPASTTQKVFSAANMPRAIQDSRTTRIDFTVAEDFTVADLNILIDITHARTSDLNIRIVAPDGRAVTLFNRRGGSIANLANVTFDDQASFAIASAAAPYSGSYRPEQGLSLFNGMKARGTWSVQVFDLVAGTTGTVNAVALIF